MTETESKLMQEYVDTFGESIAINMMPEGDRERLADVLRECIEKDEPYDNYIESDEEIYD